MCRIHARGRQAAASALDGLCAHARRRASWCSRDARAFARVLYLSGMEAQMREFVRQCLHCADMRSGDVVPRPLGETVYGTAANEVVHFDYLYVGKSGPQASQGLPEDGGFRYILLSRMISVTL